MPSSSCAASFCKNNRYNVTKRNLKIVFHSFPSQDDLRLKWVAFCQKGENWNPNKNSVLCSLHFNHDDYQMQKFNSFRNKKETRMLKASAIPTLTQRNCEDDEHDIIELPTSQADNENILVDSINNNISFEQITLLESKIREEIEKNSKLLEANTILKNNFDELYKHHEILKKQHKALEMEFKEMQQKCIQPSQLTSKVKTMMKKTLSSNQIDLILEEKQRVVWTKNELSSALTLRYFGKKSYNYLHKDLHYPLPSASTLKRYAKQINIKHGILEDVISLIENIVRTFEQRDKECVLSFDEMKVNKIMEYDSSADEIIGPHNYLQVVMAQGLFAKWKQPIFIGYDQKMTRQIMLEIITKLHEKTINVVAIVSDNCQANIGCWKELGVDGFESPYFLHPATKKKVYVFPDAPHLLKLLRNWLVDYGFHYYGNKISADLLFDLIAKRNEAEMTPLFKLNKSHIIMTPQEKQNVRRAAQLLSRSTAVSLRRYYPNNVDASNLADFIDKVNVWFDISNSYSPVAKLDTKKSYAGNDYQKRALNEMYELISNIVVIGKSSMQVFQRSILMNIKSLQMLFDDMKEKHNIRFLSTHKLNQDVLENFFSQLRQVGGVYDHPSPLSCTQRIKRIILGKSPTILHNQTYLGPLSTIQEGEALVTTNHDGSEKENDEGNEYFISANLFSDEDVMPHLSDLQSNDTDFDNQFQVASDTMSSLSSSAIELPEQDSDSLEYIIGYLAYKFQKQFPELDLGKHTFKLTSDHNYSHPPTFVQHLSVGGLFAPSESFLRQGYKMEKIFQKLNPEGILNKSVGIINTRTTKRFKRFSLVVIF